MVMHHDECIREDSEIKKTVMTDIHLSVLFISEKLCV